MTVYTQIEKVQECLKIKAKLTELGLQQNYPEEIRQFDNIVQNFIKFNEEFTDEIKFKGASRKLKIRFRNNTKWSIKVVLEYDKNI